MHDGSWGIGSNPYDLTVYGVRALLTEATWKDWLSFTAVLAFVTVIFLSSLDREPHDED